MQWHVHPCDGTEGIVRALTCAGENSSFDAILGGAKGVVFRPTTVRGGGGYGLDGGTEHTTFKLKRCLVDLLFSRRIKKEGGKLRGVHLIHNAFSMYAATVLGDRAGSLCPPNTPEGIYWVGDVRGSSHRLPVDGHRGRKFRVLVEKVLVLLCQIADVLLVLAVGRL